MLRKGHVAVLMRSTVDLDSASLLQAWPSRLWRDIGTTLSRRCWEPSRSAGVCQELLTSLATTVHDEGARMREVVKRHGGDRTQLERLIRASDRTIEEWCAVFDDTAGGMDETGTLSERQLQRWMAGQVDTARPSARRVAARVWGMDFADLLGPPTSVADELAVTTTGRRPGRSSGPELDPPPKGPTDLELANRDSNGLTSSGKEILLMAAAQRARRFTLKASASNLTSETVDQLHADVASLAVAYQQQPMTEFLPDLVETQDVLFTFLEGRQSPALTGRLLLLAGVTSGLLAKAAHDLGDAHAALTQSRTAFLCADSADHDGLRCWIRGLQSLITYWAGRPHDAIRYAQQGATFAGRSTSSTWLPVSEARAWASLGNEAEALSAIRRAEEARERVEADDIDELGGLCTFSMARQLYYAADALTWLPAQAAAAEDYASAAVDAYTDTSAPHWDYSSAAGAATNLAAARILHAEMEGAAEALTPVLALRPNQRINGIVSSANRVRNALSSAPPSLAVTALQAQLEDFTAMSAKAVMR